MFKIKSKLVILFGGLLLSLILSTPVNAFTIEDEFQAWTPSGGDTTKYIEDYEISDFENRYLMCNFSPHNSISKIYYNDIEMTKTQNHYTSAVYTLINPTIGIHDLKIELTGAWLNVHGSCYVITDVNQTDPIATTTHKVYSSGWTNPTTGDITPTIRGNLLLGNLQSTSVGVYVNSIGSAQTEIQNYQSVGEVFQNYMIGDTGLNSLNYSHDNEGSGNISNWTAEINLITPQIPETNNNAIIFEQWNKCAINTTCKIPYIYDTQLIPTDTNIIYLYDETGTNLISTSTIESYDFFGKENGQSFLTVLATTTENIYYKAKVGTDEWEDEKTVFIEFYDGITANLNDLLSATTTDTSWDVDVANMVCTVDEWASGDWWTNLRCGALFSIYNLGFKTTNSLKLIGSKIADQLKNIFPFSQIYHIIDCWNDAEDKPFSSEASILNKVNEDGDLTINFPTAWIGATTTMIVFGDTIWNDNPQMTSFFGGIRNLSTLLFWAAFIWYLYGVANLIYNETMYIKTIKKHNKENYQL